MNQTELQGKSIEALRSFNGTIVTSRLYPPDVPQVAIIVDRGYKGIKDFTRTHGDLTCSQKAENIYLCGQPLEQEILDSFTNLVVFRQLRLLGLANLVIGPEVDRFAFGQLLTVFNVSADKINNEGGGLAYITSLGLAGYFPDKVAADAVKAPAEGRPAAPRSRNLIKVRPELVACLLGKDQRPLVRIELQEKMAAAATAIEILVAGVAHILQDIQKKRMIAGSSFFPLMLQQAENLIDAGNRPEAAFGLAKVLIERLKEPALCVVSAQEFPEGFGAMLYDGLLTLLPTEKLAGIMALLREQLEKASRTGQADSSQVQLLDQALLRLTNSKKGKHLLSAEKARALMHEGERSRKKRRLEAGIKGFLQGNISLLRSDELVRYLPKAVSQLRKSADEEEVTTILHGMVAYYREGDEEIKGSLHKSIIAITEDLIADGRWSQVDTILEPLMDEVQTGSLGEALVEETVTLLHQVMHESWRAGENHRGDGILSLFHRIRTGQSPHPAALKTLVAKVQDREIRRTTLPELLARSLASPRDEKLAFRLIRQGPVVLRFLVESLVTSENTEDRLKIIDLLADSPQFLPPILHERLQEHMAWHGKRNLIKLLGETGKEADAEIVMPYLRHEDFRVQREAFLSIYKLAGRNKKRLLLRALDESSEAIKVQIVGALAPFCDLEVAGKLVELLASYEQVGEKHRNDLLLQLLESLGRCPSAPAHKGVQVFLQSRGGKGTKKISDHVWATAEQTLKFLHSELQETRKKHVQASQLRKNALLQAAKKTKTAVAQRVITGFPQEQLVRTLLARGEKMAAMEQLLELIERAARQRNFSQAEKLRNWLIEIDAAALSLTLRAAEIMDREKIAAIDKSHLEIWGGLYDILTTDEFAAVYQALKHKRYEDGEPVVDQGDMQGSLFFINSGKVKLYFDDQGSEVLVKTMGPGEIFGADAFFEVSVWTISVAAIGPSEISLLHLDALQQWVETFPGLNAKLHNFCKNSDKIVELIRRSTNDRRRHRRYRLSGRVTATLLDNRSRSVGTTFTAELVDISEGGLAFLIRISNKENGRPLLGRKMQLNLPAGDNSGKGITLVGEILAVKNTYIVENDYSLHMKFDTVIDRKHLHDIVITMRPELPVIK